MPILTADERAKLKDSDFALAGKRYPIHNIDHARNALARVSQYGSPAEKASVKTAVHKKYPKLAGDEKGEDPKEEASESKAQEKAEDKSEPDEQAKIQALYKKKKGKK